MQNNNNDLNGRSLGFSPPPSSTASPIPKEFINTLKIPGDEQYISGITRLLKDYGNIDVYKGSIAEIEPDRERASWRGFYNGNGFLPLSEIVVPDRHQIVSEIAHQAQYADHPIRAMIQAVKDYFSYGTDGSYDKPGSMEYEAHSVIEPGLWDEVLNHQDFSWGIATDLEKESSPTPYGKRWYPNFKDGEDREQYIFRKEYIDKDMESRKKSDNRVYKYRP